MHLFPRILLAATLVTPMLAGAQARTFEVHSHGMSRVSFTSDAPIETIVGTTSSVSGTITVDPAKPAGKTSTGEIRVDIGTLKTGVASRDEHLQAEQWLHAKAHPQAVFVLEQVRYKGGALKAGKAIKAKVTGKLTIRGKTLPLTADATVGLHAWTPKLEKFGIKSDLLRIKTTFSVKLADHGIAGPAVIGTKVADSVEIALNLTAVAIRGGSSRGGDAPSIQE